MVALLVGLGLSRRAAAHDVRGEVIFLDVGEQAVEVELSVPMFQLALARRQSIEQLTAAPREELAADVRGSVALRDRSGRPFGLEVGTVSVQQQEAGPAMVFALRFTPPRGASARWFELADELVLRTVVNGNVYVFVRRDLQNAVLGDSPTLVGTLHYQQRRLTVDRTAGDRRTSLIAAFHLGLDHIREGTDHLMFLLMLLVVAPLAHARRAWSTAATARRGLLRTAGIATAFTLGHSLTLALGAVAGLALPTRFVESAIAISILVSAIHAWRPVFAGKEPLIAGGFGLIHGLAFATALSGFGFDTPSLVLALLGFNLGVEAMQLVIIALTVPSLMMLARRRGYAVLRRGAAAIAMAASAVWLFERLSGVTTPLSAVLDRAARHGVWLAVGLAGLVVLSFAWSRRGRSLRTVAWAARESL